MSDLIKAQTVKLGGKDYVMVAGRLLLAHADNERMDVITEIVSYTEQAVVVKATVTTRKGVFTGHAVSLSSGKGVEGQKPLETAETSAVGRALGYAGYAIEGGIASADEVQAAQAEQAARPEPPRRTTPTPVPAPADDPARAALMDRLRAALTALGMSSREANEEVKARHHGVGVRELADSALETVVDFYERQAADVQGGAA